MQSYLQSAHLRQLRQSQSTLSSLCSWIRRQDRTVDARALSAETIAQTCQAISHYGDQIPDDVLSIVHQWVLLCRKSLSSRAASTLLQASHIFYSKRSPRFCESHTPILLQDNQFRQHLAEVFVNDIDSCPAGLVVNAAVSMTSLPFKRSQWNRIVQKANQLPLSLQEMSKLSGAYSRANLHINHPSLIKAAFNPIVETLGTLTVDDVNNTLNIRNCAELIWALSKAGMLPKRWSESVLASWLLPKIPDMPSRLLSQMISALSHAAICPSNLFLALDYRLKGDDLSKYTSQSLANVCWALIVARRPQSLPLLWKQLAESSFDLPQIELSQIHQSFLWSRLHGHSIENTDSILALSDIASKSFFSSKPTSDSNSEILQSVKRAAEHLWPNIQSETQCTKTGYWLDLVNPASAIVFEVNGPQHYCRLSSRTRGASLLKASILRRSGWTLKTIPYFEWTFGPANIISQTHFLKLKSMGIN